jgi:hypothetical protein
MTTFCADVCVGDWVDVVAGEVLQETRLPINSDITSSRLNPNTILFTLLSSFFFVTYSIIIYTIIIILSKPESLQTTHLIF